jgi:hypothetical protein
VKLIRTTLSVLVLTLVNLNVLAAPTSTSIPSFHVNCATSGSQVCEPAFSASVITTGQWQAIQLNYDVDSGHCSSVRLHIFVDGALIRTTGFLGWNSAPAPFNNLPLTTGNLVLQYVRPGVHVVSLKAEGQVSGCNTSGIGLWGGSLQTRP